MKIDSEVEFRGEETEINSNYNMVKFVILCEKKKGEHIKLRNFVENSNKSFREVKYQNKQKQYYLDNEYYNIITWEEFKEKYYCYCSRCDSWNEEQCICYAR